MSEIEKLYENAGISKQNYKTKDCDNCYYCEDAINYRKELEEKYHKKEEIICPM